MIETAHQLSPCKFPPYTHLKRKEVIMNEPPSPKHPEHEREVGGLEHPPAGTPRIYVASLSDYNAGRLHGEWLDAARPDDVLASDVTQMLRRSPEPGAEEWAIHDYDGFGRLHISEYESLEVVSRVARGIVEHGLAFAAWASVGAPFTAEHLAGFDAAYQGLWPSLEAYANELLDDFSARQELEALPAWLQPYVELDVGGFARDLELSGEITTVEGQEGVYVFDNTSL